MQVSEMMVLAATLGLYREALKTVKPEVAQEPPALAVALQVIMPALLSIA
jgi:hypothetical protein